MRADLPDFIEEGSYIRIGPIPKLVMGLKYYDANQKLCETEAEKKTASLLLVAFEQGACLYNTSMKPLRPLSMPSGLKKGAVVLRQEDGVDKLGVIRSIYGVRKAGDPESATRTMVKFAECAQCYPAESLTPVTDNLVAEARLYKQVVDRRSPPDRNILEQVAGWALGCIKMPGL